MFSVFRSGVAPRIEQTDGTFVVRFTDGAGAEHSATFHSRAAAKAFTRLMRRYPATAIFDRQEVSRLAAEFTGSQTRDELPH